MQLAEYRVDILMTIMGTYSYTILTLVFFGVIFGNIDGIGEWGKFEILTLFGIGQLIFYTHWSFFAGVDDWVSDIILNGNLDIYLTKPVNSFMNLITFKLSVVEKMPSYILALAITIYGFVNTGIQLKPLPILLCIVLMGLGVILKMLISLSISLLAFWVSKTRDMKRMYYHLFEYYKYPTDIYPKSVKLIFTTILPIGLLAYGPAYFLLKGFSLNILGSYLGALAFYITVVAILWNRGLKAYSSASS